METAPATAEAILWDGYNTALKPGYEPIILAQKPLDGTYVQNVLKWGCGALNINGCRIPTEETGHRPNKSGTLNTGAAYNGGERKKDWSMDSSGRWPANVILQHGSGCEEDICVEDCPIRIIDTQSGTLTSGHMTPGTKRRDPRTGSMRGKLPDVTTSATYADSGGASRFYTNLEPDSRFLYSGKAQRKEKEAGLDALEANDQGRRNTHPTVKPLSIMRWLVRLVKTPQNCVILDPFMGSGTTGMACVLEGVSFIGIEREEEYVKIAQARINSVKSA